MRSYSDQLSVVPAQFRSRLQLNRWSNNLSIRCRPQWRIPQDRPLRNMRYADQLKKNKGNIHGARIIVTDTPVVIGAPLVTKNFVFFYLRRSRVWALSEGEMHRRRSLCATTIPVTLILFLLYISLSIIYRYATSNATMGSAAHAAAPSCVLSGRYTLRPL